MKFNRTQLKYIAIVTMLIDHIAWGFVPLNTPLAQIMHFIGRFTGPTMAYFLAEGYIHTSDKKKYGTRLLVFALISWIPFCSFENGMWCIGTPINVFFTLFLGFLAMAYCDKREKECCGTDGRYVREKAWSFKDGLLIVGLCMISFMGDWPVFDVLWPYLLFKYRHDEKLKWQAFWMLSIASVVCFIDTSNIMCYVYNLGCLVPGFVLQKMYSGEPGKKNGFNKWFFYVFYPLHLTVLAIIRIYF